MGPSKEGGLLSCGDIKGDTKAATFGEGGRAFFALDVGCSTWKRDGASLGYIGLQPE